MRGAREVRENLAWLTTNCRHYKDSEHVSVVNQLATLLWVLGAERAEAEAEAEGVWASGRAQRHQNPSDY